MEYDSSHGLDVPQTKKIFDIPGIDIMLNVPQIEALRKENPHLYEALTSIAQASLGPNQGWSLDNQITDGVNYSRVSSGATTAGKIDPTKTGVLMKGSV